MTAEQALRSNSDLSAAYPRPTPKRARQAQARAYDPLRNPPNPLLQIGIFRRELGSTHLRN